MARILILEDEISLAADWQKLLERHHHQIVCCATVEQALALLASSEFDLIIADMLIKVKGKFAGAGGLTLIGKRTMGDTPPIPIIGVSGCKPNPEILPTSPLQIAQGMGVDIALYKPIKPNELLNAINRIMAQVLLP